MADHGRGGVGRSGNRIDLAEGCTAARVAALGAAAAGASIFGTSALSGSGGSAIPSLIEDAVDWRNATGSKGSNAGYDKADPANDRKAATLLKPSRQS